MNGQRLDEKDLADELSSLIFDELSSLITDELCPVLPVELELVIDDEEEDGAFFDELDSSLLE